MNHKATPSINANDALVEGLGCAVIVIDNEHIVQRVNIAAETLFVQSRRHLVGQSLDNLIDSAWLFKCLRECSQNNTAFDLWDGAISSSDIMLYHLHISDLSILRMF